MSLTTIAEQSFPVKKFTSVSGIDEKHRKVLVGINLVQEKVHSVDKDVYQRNERNQTDVEIEHNAQVKLTQRKFVVGGLCAGTVHERKGT